jgi:hypothetical protein
MAATHNKDTVVDDNKLYTLLSHSWEAIVSVLSATMAYLFYRKRKHDDQLDKLIEDNIVFQVEIREIKEDIKEIKEWLFLKKRNK